MGTLRTVVLLAATLTTGLAAGVFALYAHTIMPALKTTDDRTLVGAFQAIDRAIINVPLNDAIKAAGDPATIDVDQVRADFDEARWATWNLVRVAAFASFAWALVLDGRAEA